MCSFFRDEAARVGEGRRSANRVGRRSLVFRTNGRGVDGLGLLPALLRLCLAHGV